MSQDVSEIQIPEKSAVFRFSGRRKDTAYFWKIREKISGKIGRFRKISENRKSENSGGKFRKKVPKRRFWKIQPSFAERVLKHILRAKIDKKKMKI
jgi:hypothetical protein